MVPGGRYTLSSGREVVSLTLDSSDRTDAGNWTCTAQVYESGTGSLPVGGPVEISVQLVVVGEFQSVLFGGMDIIVLPPLSSHSCSICTRRCRSRAPWTYMDFPLLVPINQGHPPSLPPHDLGGGRWRGENCDSGEQ